MPPVVRKYHRKSKTGCAECKRRHIKCDEGRPVCVNCATIKAQCPYLGLTELLDSPSPSPPSQNPSSTVAAYIDLWPSTSAASIEVNMLHLELFNQFTSSTCTSFVTAPEEIAIYRQSIIDCAFVHPFLMYEILAFSALHLSLLKPLRQASYQQLATSLQAKSLSTLENTLANVDENTCLPVLFFSHIIGIHSFFDTVALCNEPFSRFHKHLIATLNLWRGVQAVIQPWLDVMKKSAIGDIITTAERLRASVKDVTNSLNETDQLRNLIRSAEINEATTKVYEDALMTLQQDFDAAHLTDTLTTSKMVFSWLITLSNEYTKLLDEQRPEALVILAYYTVVLHRRRKSWIVGDAGKSVLSIILSYLGERWDPWLAWPKAEVLGI